MGAIKVVCGVIYKNDKVFICRRKADKSLGGYWEFPGGKIETGEHSQHALQRELSEELQMEVGVGEYIGSSDYDYDTFSIELIAYSCQFKRWNEHLTDHDEFAWVAVEELKDYQMAPADLPLIPLLS